MIDSYHRNIKASQDPRVYSYMRFSTPEQKLGDSERRQVDDAKGWATRKGLVLDESLRMVDEGRSGYHGTHRKRGALGAFLAEVEAGRVPTGSMLLVENLDRLSREGFVVALRDIIFKLWDKGITLVTLNPEEKYEPGCGNDPKVVFLFMILTRAHDESKQKSRRIKAARDQARKLAAEHKKILTSRCPAWLTANPDGRGFTVAPKAERTIKQIYEWVLEGLSTRKIEAKLNTEPGHWMPPPRSKMAAHGNGWRTSYVQKLLRNPAVIGVCQPHENHAESPGKRRPIGEPIPEHFPPIVDEGTYFAVRDKLAKNKSIGGRTGFASNVFKGLMRCAYCGGPMRYVDKGKTPKGAVYLICDNGVRRVMRDGQLVCSGSHRMRYDEATSTILANCVQLEPSLLLPSTGKQAAQCDALRVELADLQHDIDIIDTKLGRMASSVGDAPSKSVQQRIYAAMEQLDEELRNKRERQATATVTLQTVTNAEQDLTEWQAGLSKLMVGFAKGTPEQRIRLRNHLASFIDHVECFAVGFGVPPHVPAPIAGPFGTTARKRASAKTPMRDDTDEVIAGMFDDAGVTMGPREWEFVEWVQARLRTREGRFWRVHYRCGAVADMVPTGGLASGLATHQSSGVRRVGPDYDQLWIDYCKSNPSPPKSVKARSKVRKRK